MDEAVIQYYRRLLREDFPHAGEIRDPTIFVEAIGERMIHCGNTGNYMQIYLRVVDRRIGDIRYLCACEPVANVAVEVLCTLAKGKTLDEATDLSEEAFYQFLGCRSDDLHQKVRGLLELLNEGIARYRGTATGEKGPVAEDGGERGGKLNWDGALSI